MRRRPERRIHDELVEDVLAVDVPVEAGGGQS